MFGLFTKKYQSLSMEQAKDELDHNDNIVLVDVRTPEEYRSGHIQGSVNIPLDSLDAVERKIPDKDSRIFVYCLSGARSRMACQLMAASGYNDITNIGGISSWSYGITR